MSDSTLEILLSTFSYRFFGYLRKLFFDVQMIKYAFRKGVMRFLEAVEVSKESRIALRFCFPRLARDKPSDSDK